MNLLVNRRVVRGFNEADGVERVFLRIIAFALRDNLVISRFQVPIPLVIRCGLPNLKIHGWGSFL